MDCPRFFSRFPRWTVPVWEEVDIFSGGLSPFRNLCQIIILAIWKDGAWVPLTPKAVKTEKWMRELDFGERVSAEKLRLTFADGKKSIPKLEVYEVEIGR